MKVTKSYLKQVILEELQQEVASMDEAQVDESQLEEAAVGNTGKAAFIALSLAITSMGLNDVKQKLDKYKKIISTENIGLVPQEDKVSLYRQITKGDPVADGMIAQPDALNTFLAGEVDRKRVKIVKTGEGYKAQLINQTSPVK